MILNQRPADATPVAHDRVYRSLRGRIMQGAIAPGEALTLRGIGKDYEVSMTPAREAVRRLLHVAFDEMPELPLMDRHTG